MRISCEMSAGRRLTRSIKPYLFVWVDTLCPSQHFFSHFWKFPGLNQYLEEDNVSCSSKNHSASGEARTSNPGSQAEQSTTEPLRS